MLSIVVPAYFEEKNISHLYGEIVQALSQNKIEFEIIFVDDGSKDHTYEEISKIANIKIGTVKSKLARARADLKEKLGSRRVS